MCVTKNTSRSANVRIVATATYACAATDRNPFVGKGAAFFDRQRKTPVSRSFSFCYSLSAGTFLIFGHQ